MIPRLLLSAVLLASLCIACTVARPPESAAPPTGSASAPASGRAESSSTRTPLLEAPSGTGVLSFGPGSLGFSQSCLAEAGMVQTPEATDTPGPSPAASVPPTDTPAPASTSRPPLARALTPAPPQPYEPIPLVEDQDFKDDLLDILGDEAGHYAFVIKDLNSGRGAQFNADKAFYAASVFKLWVMYEVFNQQAQGLVDWSNELVVTPYYESFVLSPGGAQLCEVLSVAEAMRLMLSVSDNVAAVLLQDLVGSGNVNTSIAKLGVKTSGLFEDGLPLTAEDVALLLEAIARGAAFSPDASADMLQLMAGELLNNGLKDGLPGEVVVAHKTGNWDDATHDVGVVFAPFGTYLFVALSDTNHETQLIKALSEAAYAYFEDR